MGLVCVLKRFFLAKAQGNMSESFSPLVGVSWGKKVENAVGT